MIFPLAPLEIFLPTPLGAVPVNFRFVDRKGETNFREAWPSGRYKLSTPNLPHSNIFVTITLAFCKVHYDSLQKQLLLDAGVLTQTNGPDKLYSTGPMHNRPFRNVLHVAGW